MTATIGERIREIRGEISMAAFGEQIKMSDSNISKMEKGLRAVTDRTIEIICEKFNVNEEWIKHGTGEMYVKKKPHEEMGYELGKLLREKGEYTEFKQRLITHMLRLPESHWMVICDLIDGLVAEELDKIKKSEEI